MSGTQVSGFADPNILYKSLSGLGTAEVLQKQNDLLVQQQQIGAGDTEMAARIASTLQALPTPEARASAYPTMLAQARANGYRLPHAPETYPGDDAIAATARMGTPSTTQQEWQANIAANKAISAANTPAAATATGGAGGSARPLTGDLETDRKIISQRESGGDPTALNYVAVADPTAYGRGATASGKYQFVNSTWREGMQLAGLDPAQYPTAMSAPESVQDKVFTAVYGKYGTKPWDPSTYGQAWVTAPGGRMVLVKGTTTPTTTAVAPGSPPAASTTPPGVQMGGAVPPPPWGAPGAYGGGGMGMVIGGQPAAVRATIPAGRPSGPPVITDQPAGSNVVAGPPGTAVVGQPVPPSPAVPGNVAAISAGIVGAGGQPVTDPNLTPTPARYAGTVPAPSVEAAPETGWGTGIGSGYGPQNALAPAPVPPAPAQPARPVATAPAPSAPSAPAGGPQPPHLDPLLPNGLTARQQATLDALGNTGKMTGQARLAAEQQYAQQNIALQQKQFSDWIQVQQLQTSQGQLSVSQQNSALEYWKAAHPDAKVTMTGGEIITQDPRTGQEIAPRIQVTPQRADTAAMAIVSRLGPKVANGTATPDEQAQYAVAVDSYRQPTLRENPVTKETLRVNTRELPAGFPEPPGLGAGAPGASGTGGGSNVVMPGLSPAQQQIERDKGRYDIGVKDLDKDRGEISAISDAGRSAQQDNLRVQEMRDILTNANTGPGTETAAHLRAWIARWTPGKLAEWDGSGANLSNPAAIEMFQKLGFVGAVTQERGATSRGGYQATQLFQKFNPGAQLLTSTNEGLLAQRLIANQAEADYAQGAQDHYNTQHQRLKSPEQEYDPLSVFDAKWQAQRNPQVYAAAIGALGGQDGDMWSKGLSKDEIQRVKDVVARADPKAVINMPGDAPTGRNRPPLTSFQR